MSWWLWLWPSWLFFWRQQQLEPVVRVEESTTVDGHIGAYNKCLSHCYLVDCLRQDIEWCGPWGWYGCWMMELYLNREILRIRDSGMCLDPTPPELIRPFGAWEDGAGFRAAPDRQKCLMEFAACQTVCWHTWGAQMPKMLPVERELLQDTAQFALGQHERTWMEEWNVWMYHFLAKYGNKTLLS